jgi:hypothetical protein
MRLLQDAVQQRPAREPLIKHAVGTREIPEHVLILINNTDSNSMKMSFSPAALDAEDKEGRVGKRDSSGTGITPDRFEYSKRACLAVLDVCLITQKTPAELHRSKILTIVLRRGHLLFFVGPILTSVKDEEHPFQLAIDYCSVRRIDQPDVVTSPRVRAGPLESIGVIEGPILFVNNAR